ncbi:hypothetical protein SAMN05216242_1603, partial [Thauera chlorobenzoica]
MRVGHMVLNIALRPLVAATLLSLICPLA